METVPIAIPRSQKFNCVNSIGSPTSFSPVNNNEMIGERMEIVKPIRRPSKPSILIVEGKSLLSQLLAEEDEMNRMIRSRRTGRMARSEKRCPNESWLAGNSAHMVKIDMADEEGKRSKRDLMIHFKYRVDTW